MNLITKIKNKPLADNQLAICWLGQAGFLLADKKGHILAIDPYLTHCAERIKGFIRIAPILIEPEELIIDACLISHKHFDHLDYDAWPLICANPANKDAILLGSPSAVATVDELKLGRIDLMQDDINPLWDGASVKAVFADHGDLDTEARGMVLNWQGFSIYISGDTGYRPDAMGEVKDSAPDIMIASVNGRFGNLDAWEGAKMAAYTGAKSLIPCHFGNFIEHGPMPEQLGNHLAALAPNCSLQYLTLGQIYTATKAKDNTINFMR